MPVSFVGAVAAHRASGVSGTVAPDFSGQSWDAGDLAVAVAQINNASTSLNVTAPTGWRKERIFFDNTAGDTRGQVLFWKVLEEGEDETPEFTFGALTNARSVAIGIWDGVDATFPFDALSQIVQGVNDANPTPAPFTTVTADTLGEIALAVTQATLTAGGAPSGYSLQAAFIGSSFINAQQLLASKALSSAGTETPGDWANSFSGTGLVEESNSFSFALRKSNVITDLPLVIDEKTTAFTTNATSHPANYPDTVSAGQLLILHAAFDGTPTITNPSGWNRIDPGGVGTGTRHIMTWKVASGSEGGNTVDVVTSVAETGAAVIWLIDNWDSAEVPEFTSVSSANAPSLTASWGAGPNLWFTGAVLDLAGVSATGIHAPSNFQYLFSTVREFTGLVDMQLNAARWASALATTDPDSWLVGASPATWTMVVKGDVTEHEFLAELASEQDTAFDVSMVAGEAALNVELAQESDVAFDVLMIAGEGAVHVGWGIPIGVG